MYRLVSALLLSLFALAPAYAQETVTAGDICKTKGACREVTTLRLEAADGTEQIIPVNGVFPWVVNANIMMFIGDSVTVRLVEAGDHLDPVLVRAGAESAATAPGPGEIRFNWAPSSQGQTSLEVLSRYPKILDYSLIIVTAAGPNRTSVCSLQPGITVFENWQDPVVQMAALHFIVTDDPGCRTIVWGKAKAD